MNKIALLFRVEEVGVDYVADDEYEDSNEKRIPIEAEDSSERLVSYHNLVVDLKFLSD